MTKIKAIIFDMDGVLVHSEPVILQAAITALRELGADPKPEDFTEFIGTGEDSFIGGVAKKYGIKYHIGIKKRTYDIYDEIVYDKIGIYDGVVDTIVKLKDMGYKLAVASAADKRKVIVNLAAAGIDTDLFDVILASEDVVNKKPAPDVYILTAQKLGILCEEGIVVEDAIKGIKAAHLANMKCIAVTTAFSREELINNKADYVVELMPDIISVL